MNKKITYYIFSFTMLIVTFSSCQKYYIDSGTHAPKYDGTVMEYIKMRKDIFDSLYKVIQLSGLESELNRNGVTFFAPGDASIRKSIYALNEVLHILGRDTVYTLDQIDAEVWREYLSMYIYTNTYLLKDIPQLDTNNMNVYPGQAFLSIGNQNMNMGVLYNDVVSKGDNNQQQVVKYGGYRQLYLSYIVDVSNTEAAGGMVNSPVATSDIQTNNGVIHALEYRRHTFGFVVNNFINSAYTKGIKDN
ncbi:hypothetical protein G5B30_06730 [Sphingobacterium sp. SGG-5]|uniref:fasciclin domain-containing protein n=1 Tax=Sphingobacterium sp. SGG-5 TaxID=2710881 RepID=UPI0013EACAF8|nr:fasciclin domain-containing protein [Sphingobacterium sp. SGG-5]NGM61610.1 hypothetical protein [Sphingobacterium sp. SGG-5]